MPISQAEMSDYYKENAATHEAGHATVGVVLGCYGSAWLRRNDSGDAEEKLWLGHYRGPIGRLELDSQAVVGVAGMVADEWVVFRESSAEEIMESWAIGSCCPSPSDLESVPREPARRLRAVREALHILRQQRPLFELVVAHLINHELVTEAELKLMAGTLLQVPPQGRAN